MPDDRLRSALIYRSTRSAQIWLRIEIVREFHAFRLKKVLTRTITEFGQIVKICFRRKHSPSARF
jgi:hypothetical protein